MIRRGLGRGLDALIESTDGAMASDSSPARAGIGGSGVLSVELDQIVPSPLQPRRHFDSGRLQELAQAIRSQGVIEPLVVRPAPSVDGAAARYELVAGERRWRAARIAGLSVVPIVVRELDDHAALEMSLVENLMREDLNPVDEAHGFERLARSFGMSHEQVAARRFVEGRISARGAEELAGAARRARGGSIRAAAAGNPNLDPNLAALADAMQRGLKRKVRIVRARGRKPGRIEIEFYGVDDLSALAATLGAAARTHSAAS